MELAGLEPATSWVRSALGADFTEEDHFLQGVCGFANKLSVVCIPADSRRLSSFQALLAISASGHSATLNNSCRGRVGSGTVTDSSRTSGLCEVGPKE